MNKLSVTIITLNEEKRLETCLESVRWADEIVIVDSFSSDRTIEIAKKFGCKIFQKNFEGFGNLKNYAVSQASNTWVLNIDADERVSEGLEREIEEVLQDPKYDGYYIPRKCFVGKKWIKYAGQWPDYQLRLFRKDRGGFQDRLVHERVMVRGDTACLRNPIIHRNYDSWHHYFVKSNFYSTKEAQELLSKTLVWMYPFGVIRDFFSRYGNSRRKGNSVKNSYIMARTALEKYELGWTIPFKPGFAFIRFFILQQGFRDGVYGLIWALGSMCNRIMKYAKYHDMKKGNKEAYDDI